VRGKRRQGKPPLILVGSPRTGSTKLQKLLAASGDRKEDPATRIEETEDCVRWTDAIDTTLH
jgi:LPS sulfotransferase NodH